MHCTDVRKVVHFLTSKADGYYTIGFSVRPAAHRASGFESHQTVALTGLEPRAKVSRAIGNLKEPHGGCPARNKP